MAEYIDTYELITQIISKYGDGLSVYDLADVMDSIPTITITFCPYCIHRWRHYNGQTWCALDDRPITDNDFCSSGKEKCDE